MTPQPTRRENREIKSIKMFKDGNWVEWNGTDDCEQLIVEEEITMEQYNKYYKNRNL
jgi:hypothetical protein